MRVLIACEFSGVVRRAFRNRGHDAWSCDLLPSDDDSKHHIIGDVISLLKPFYKRKPMKKPFDMVIAHPPCTHLAVSGARWFKEKAKQQFDAINFFLFFTELHGVEHVAIENPVSIMSTIYRKPDQIIQPWQFGHGETKATCLWLKNLPKLKPTKIVDGREARIHKMPPSKDRWKKRSITYQGIADAMAEQWG